MPEQEQETTKRPSMPEYHVLMNLIQKRIKQNEYEATYSETAEDKADSYGSCLWDCMVAGRLADSVGYHEDAKAIFDKTKDLFSSIGLTLSEPDTSTPAPWPVTFEIESVDDEGNYGKATLFQGGVYFIESPTKVLNEDVMDALCDGCLWEELSWDEYVKEDALERKNLVEKIDSIDFEDDASLTEPEVGNFG